MKLIRLWVPVAFWAAVIFYFSGVPNLKTELSYDFLLRKIAHVVEYAVLAFFLYRAIKGTFVIKGPASFFYPFMVAALYAISDEIHQSFVPGRTCSVQDILIDTLGVLIFYGIILNAKIRKTVTGQRS